MVTEKVVNGVPATRSALRVPAVNGPPGRELSAETQVSVTSASATALVPLPGGQMGGGAFPGRVSPCWCPAVLNEASRQVWEMPEARLPQGFSALKSPSWWVSVTMRSQGTSGSSVPAGAVPGTNAGRAARQTTGGMLWMIVLPLEGLNG